MRKEQILQMLGNETEAISATTLAKHCGVSRQAIVGDIALLRAAGEDIISTPKGYLLTKSSIQSYTIACKHDVNRLLEELYTVVDLGCGLLDVIVSHTTYGELKGNLHIFSRSDADEFVTNMKKNNAEPLCMLTNQMHLHTLTCPSEKHFLKVKEALLAKGFLV